MFRALSASAVSDHIGILPVYSFLSLCLPDFGLAKDLYSSDYYQVEGQRKLPVRWMAPEALLQGKFTMESDIW